MELGSLRKITKNLDLERHSYPQIPHNSLFWKEIQLRRINAFCKLFIINDVDKKFHVTIDKVSAYVGEEEYEDIAEKAVSYDAFTPKEIFDDIVGNLDLVAVENPEVSNVHPLFTGTKKDYTKQYTQSSIQETGRGYIAKDGTVLLREEAYYSEKPHEFKEVQRFIDGLTEGDIVKMSHERYIRALQQWFPGRVQQRLLARPSSVKAASTGTDEDRQALYEEVLKHSNPANVESPQEAYLAAKICIERDTKESLRVGLRYAHKMLKLDGYKGRGIIFHAAQRLRELCGEPLIDSETLTPVEKELLDL